MGHGTVADEIKGRAAQFGGERARRDPRASRRRACASAPTSTARRAFMGPETSMEVQAALGLGHRAGLRRVHAVPRRPRLHRALDRAHAPLARALPGLARARTAPRASSSTASCRAASTRTCAARRPRRSPPRALGGIAIGGSLGRGQGADVRGRRAGRPPELPEDTPRHLLGIGEIDDLVRGVELGIDTFDCAMPTRLGRHGMALVPDPRAAAGASTSPRRAGSEADEPMLEGCPCPACAAGYTRGYLHYLFKDRELTGHAPARRPQPRVRAAR